MKVKASTLMIGLAIVGTGVLVVLAFQQVGSPSTQRALEADRQRYRAIFTIHSRLRTDLSKDSAMKRFEPLPEKLALESIEWSRWEPTPHQDPETGKPFPVTRLDDTSYRLEVKFAFSSDEYTRRTGEPIPEALRGSAGIRRVTLRLGQKLRDW